MKAFVSFLSKKHGIAGLKVDCWPEDKNRSSKDIDAIAGPFAIEHTSIDTVEKQREASDHFNRVVGGIREELVGEVPFRLKIIVEWSAVRVRQVWSAIRGAMKDWILTEAPSLPDGCHVIDDGTIPGVPFGLMVRKASDRPPDIIFGRTEPHDDALSARIRKQFDKKAGKLAKYASQKTTILLLESSDMALMNEEIMLDAIKAAYSDALPAGVDQVWYADTSSGPGAEVMFKDFTRDVRE
jgi:hypothetical protein